MISLICENKTTEQTQQNRSRVIDTENKQVIAKGEVGKEEERKRCGRLRGTNFQLQNK